MNFLFSHSKILVVLCHPFDQIPQNDQLLPIPLDKVLLRMASPWTNHVRSSMMWPKPLMKTKLSSILLPKPSTLACMACTPSSTQRNRLTAWVLQYPQTRNSRCCNEQLGILLPFLSTYSNSTHLSRPRTSMKPSLGILIPVSPTLLQPASILLQRKLHTLISISLLSTQALSLSFPLSSKCSKVSNLGSNPWPFPNSSLLQCLIP